jgi:hypothetical protein
VGGGPSAVADAADTANTPGTTKNALIQAVRPALEMSGELLDLVQIRMVVGA